MPTSPVTEMDTAVWPLGSDPFMRFDVWAARAWEAAQEAVKVAAASDPAVNLDAGIDTRIVTLFHASDLAKEFAAMTNPLFAAGPGGGEGGAAVGAVEADISMLLDDDD